MADSQAPDTLSAEIAHAVLVSRAVDIARERPEEVIGAAEEIAWLRARIYAAAADTIADLRAENAGLRMTLVLEGVERKAALRIAREANTKVMHAEIELDRLRAENARLRRIEGAAQQILADVIARYGITDADGFTSPPMRALFKAAKEAEDAR